LYSYAPEKIPSLIESNDADLRNQAGETIAVLYEVAREINSVSRRIRLDRKRDIRLHFEDLCRAT